MNTSILNYPGFQTLPKGVKQMLVASESHFFDQPAPHRKEQNRAAQKRTKISFPRWQYAGYESPGFLRSLEHCLNVEP